MPALSALGAPLSCLLSYALDSTSVRRAQCGPACGAGSAVVGGLGDVVGLSGALAVAVLAPVAGVLVLATARRSAAWGGRAGDT